MKGKIDEKKINGVLYDTATASLIAETGSRTALSGRISTRLFKSYSGQWFQSISPVKGNGYQIISNWISPNTARSWLERHNCHFQLREYFGYSDNRVKPERQVFVAELKSPTSNSNELTQVERLYHHPQKGWCLKQTKEAALIPLTIHKAASITKALQLEKGHIRTPLPSMKTYMYERGHSELGSVLSLDGRHQISPVALLLGSDLPVQVFQIQVEQNHFHLVNLRSLILLWLFCDNYLVRFTTINLAG